MDKQRLKAAIKKPDGWWASIFSGKVANIFLYFVADIKWISPNLVTSISILVCFIACFVISSGLHLNLILGAILLQLTFILDCLDGQIARYRKEGSNFGAWYDRVSDRIKDFIIYFAIAYGYFKTNLDWEIWPLAMTSLFFVYLFDYYVNQDVKLEARMQGNKETRKIGFGILNRFFSLGEKVYKSIPILQFHIGEQYLLISLFLIFNQVKFLFYLIILLGVFYMFYWPSAKYYGRKPQV